MPKDIALAIPVRGDAGVGILDLRHSSIVLYCYVFSADLPL